MKAAGEVKAIVLKGAGEVVVAGSLAELESFLDESGESEVTIILIRGEVLTVLKPVKASERLQIRSSVEQAMAAQPAQRPPAQPQQVEPAQQEGVVALVLDQMFRGFAGILERELKQAPVEIHEVVGRGLQSTIKVSERVYQEPANDDFDVLKLVEALASRARTVVFYTGDKKLARQASALGLANVAVKYMPPNEYPGKETLVKAMVDAAREILAGPNGSAGRQAPQAG